MSRPYININSMTYSSGVLSMNYTFYKLRTAPTTLTITGFSNSISYTEIHNNCDFTSGATSETLTFSVPVLGIPTANSYSFTDPSISMTFSGTVSTTTNLKVTVNGIQVINATSSAGPTLSNFLTQIVSSSPYTVSGLSGQLTVATASLGTSSINGLVFTPTNTGNFYNNTALVATPTRGAGSLTMSTTSVTISGGSTNYGLVLTYSDLGYTDGFNYTY